MPEFDINSLRLQNQHLAGPRFTDPADVVRYLGAVQSQDYNGAVWALGQRLKGANADSIDKAFAKGDIIRTHVLRPTWHFVAPEDVRWMLDLTAKRIRMHTATRLRFFELNDAIFAKCAHIITRLLEGGKQLPRTDIAVALRQGGIATDEQRFIHIMMELELQQLICSGGREGKHLTYALLDERVPRLATMDTDEALAKLAERYFTSHGPATLQDFAWWSGLTQEECRIGLETVKSGLEMVGSGSTVYWMNGGTGNTAKPSGVLLLPNYDEYIVSYKDRSSSIDAKHIDKADPRGTLFNNTVIVNGRIAGIWKRELKKDTVTVQVTPFKPFSKAAGSALMSAAKRYAKFLGLKEHQLHVASI
ncbi:MAG: AlkZ family DNA glycosylase [Bacteroidetes bacterium]|nr:AlkZ family DNA glycosylase [Bacteroidota bacterium]